MWSLKGQTRWGDFFASEGRKNRCLEWIYAKVLGLNRIEDDLHVKCELFGGLLICMERLVSVLKAGGNLLT